MRVLSRRAEGRLTSRLALITGASRGIGAAVAERFAAEGAELILVARTAGGLEETDDRVRAAGGRAVLVPLDLRDGPAIDRLGGTVAKRWGRLDILVGNAAMLGTLSPLAHYDPETWERVIGLNLTANWRLIRSFDALLRASDAGRVVFVTSGLRAGPAFAAEAAASAEEAGRFGAQAGAAEGALAYWGAYAASKAALESMALTYAAELRKTNVKVNLLDPGVVRTRMRAEAFPGEDPMSLPAPESVTEAFVALAAPSCRKSGARVSA